MEPRRAPLGARVRRVQGSLTGAEWRRVGAMGALILGLHVVGFFLLFAFVAPKQFELGDGGIFGIGLGFTAYTLGMRHAFDADHIGAIDNTTRKLISDGRRPMGVGFFFSLGHSTIVFILAAAFAFGIRGLSGAVDDDDSFLHQATGLIGPTVSGTFLIFLGILNLIVLVGIYRIFKRMKRGDFDEQELEEQLDKRGFMNRFYGRATNTVTKSWQMYPIGCLFGLGFDTATEIALLATAGSAAAGGLPFYAILCLPILFAAGMTLLDTIDGILMNFAYGWAFTRPIRKIFYNLTITGLSVFVALAIGTIELMSVFTEKLSLTGQPWDFISGIDLNYVGYALVGLFLLTWAAVVAVWRYGRIEERWSVRLAEGGGAGGGGGS